MKHLRLDVRAPVAAPRHSTGMPNATTQIGLPFYVITRLRDRRHPGRWSSPPTGDFDIIQHPRSTNAARAASFAIQTWIH
jgi:hypothetical protein